MGQRHKAINITSTHKRLQIHFAACYQQEITSFWIKGGEGVSMKALRMGFVFGKSSKLSVGEMHCVLQLGFGVVKQVSRLKKESVIVGWGQDMRVRFCGSFSAKKKSQYLIQPHVSYYWAFSTKVPKKLFHNLRCWYGLVLSDSLVQLTFQQEDKKCFKWIILPAV